jgi:hypothetical protein
VAAETVGAAPVAAETVGAAPVAEADGATAERVVGALEEGAATVGEVAAVPVGLVDAGAVGVVLPPPAVAVAITGEIGEPEGVAVVMPEGVELSAYGLHIRTRLLAPTVIEIDVDGSTTTEMELPVAVKGPSVAGAAGRFSVTPVGGTGVGIGVSIVIVPLEMAEGVAPVASTLVLVVPVIAVCPSDSAVCARVSGIIIDVE